MRPRNHCSHNKDSNGVEETFIARTNGTTGVNFKTKPIFKGVKKSFITDSNKNALRPPKTSLIVSEESSSRFFASLFGFSDTKKNKTSSTFIPRNQDYCPPIGENCYFSDKAVLSKGISPYRHLKLPEKESVMQMSSFLSQFNTQEDINNLELTHMLDIDYEKLEELKEKSLEFIDASTLSLETYVNEGDEDILVFFTQKLQELRENDINIQIFIQNIEKVHGIKYEKDGARIYFKC